MTMTPTKATPYHLYCNISLIADEVDDELRAMEHSGTDKSNQYYEKVGYRNAMRKAAALLLELDNKVLFSLTSL